MSFDWKKIPLFAPSIDKPCVAISACLNGAAVRYDGSDKLLPGVNRFLHDALDLLSICPEVGAGMATPRPPVQLVASSKGLKALGRDDPDLDVTAPMLDYAQFSVREYGDKICAYIFKSRSPSCGVGSTPLFSQQGEIIERRSGIQAAAFQHHFPGLVYREETQLQTEEQCMQFIQMCRFSRDLIAASKAMTLQQLHSHYKPLLIQLSIATQQALEQRLSENPGPAYQTLFVQSVDRLTAVYPEQP